MHGKGLVAVLLLSLAACSTPSRESYAPAEVGRVLEMTEGEVVATRSVQIEGRNSGTGAGAGVGGVGGAIAASGQIGLAAVLVGSVIGAVVGFVAEDALGDREGTEYIVQLDDGRLVTVIQNKLEDEEPLAIGTQVYVQSGGTYSRVIEKPEAAKQIEAKDWVNPDDLPPDTAPKDGATDSEDAPAARPLPPGPKTPSRPPPAYPSF